MEEMRVDATKGARDQLTGSTFHSAENIGPESQQRNRQKTSKPLSWSREVTTGLEKGQTLSAYLFRAGGRIGTSLEGWIWVPTTHR